MSTRATAESLVSAANDLLEIGGPEAVTMRSVGAAAGVSRTAPYRHFRDKDDLLHAVAAAILKNLGNAMERYAADNTIEGSELYRACLGYVQEAIDHPERYNLVFGRHQLDEPSTTMSEIADAAVLRFYRYVAQAQHSDGLRKGDVRTLTAIIWSALHGIVSLTLSSHLVEPRMIDGASRYPELIRQLIDGLSNKE